jgi:arabinofuranosyltransferase
VKAVKNLSRIDGLFLILFALVGLWLVVVSVNKPVHPAEDAAMLMRYSQNLAQGNGIVWNIGQAPVDGATDFLFMAVLAGLYAMGGGLESTVLWVGGLAHILTVLLVYIGVRRCFKGGVLAAVISAAFLLFGPGLRYVESSFGTSFFALFCCLSWFSAQMVVEQPHSIGRAFFFAFCCLLMGLTRPEGVLFAGFILLAILFRLGWKTSVRIIAIFTGVFLLLGGAYFLWRWSYFGYPLPNPF